MQHEIGSVVRLGLCFKRLHVLAGAAFIDQHFPRSDLACRGEHDATIGEEVRTHVIGVGLRVIDRARDLSERAAGDGVFPDVPGRRGEVLLIGADGPAHREYQGAAIRGDVQILGVPEVVAGHACGQILFRARRARAAAQIDVGLGPVRARQRHIIFGTQCCQRGRVRGHRALDVSDRKIDVLAAIGLTTADIEIAMTAAGGNSRRQRNAQQAGMGSH